MKHVFKNVTEAWRILQVRKYAYSVRNGVITEEVAQKLRNGTFKASDVSEPKNTGKAKFKDSGKTEVSKAKNTAKTSQSSASSTSKRKGQLLLTEQLKSVCMCPKEPIFLVTISSLQTTASVDAAAGVRYLHAIQCLT